MVLYYVTWLMQYNDSTLEGSSFKENRNEEVLVLKLDAVCLQTHSHKSVLMLDGC